MKDRTENRWWTGLRKMLGGNGAGAVANTASRRDFLKSGASIAAGAAASQMLTGATATAADEGEDNRTLARLERSNGDNARRVLLKGAVVITMDPTLGNFAQADVLIEGKKIAAVGADLSASAKDGKAIVINAKDSILIPGFADPHIHSWQGQLGRIIPNSNGVANDDKHNYTSVMHQLFAPYYRPQDMYIGDLMTALSCLDAGITCMCDNSHNTRSAAHSDATIRGLSDSGLRAVYGCGPARFGDWDHQWPKDLSRIKKQFFSSSDQLVTFRMFLLGPPASDPEVLRMARDLDLWISFDGGANSAMVPGFYRDGLLVGHESYNHGGGIPEANWQAMREHGAKITLAPRSDSQFFYGGAGTGINAIQDVLDHGMRPGISNDNPSAYGIDMFEEMHTVYFFQRAMAQHAKSEGKANFPAAITARDVLEFATIRGAENCGLGDKCGSLTPGKEADVVMIRTDNMHLYSVNNAIGVVVQAATIGNVDTVFVAGQARKWRGQLTNKLLGHDLGKIRQLADESRDYLLTAAGWKLDIFSD